MQTQKPEDRHTRGALHKPQSPNTSWFEETGTWYAYGGMLVIARVLLAVLPTPLFAAAQWTAWNVVHNLVTFIVFHWMKGDPYADELGASSPAGGVTRKGVRLTVWEQLDSGVQFTLTRKFLTMVPVAMLYLTAHYTDFDDRFLLLNIVSFLLVVIPKAPFMQKRRLLNLD